MDDNQDFAYAVSDKALRNIAETAAKDIEGVGAVTKCSVSVKDGSVAFAWAFVLSMALTCMSWPSLSKSVPPGLCRIWPPPRALIFPLL